MKNLDYRLYLVTDFPSSYPRNWLESVESALDGGVSLVQYRNESACAREQYEQALALRDLLRGRGVPLIINNLTDLAVAIDADGVHVGQNDLPVDIVRKLLGPERILGLSTSTAAQVEAADARVVDYIGAGPVFPTQSKRNAPAAIGVEGLRSLVKLANVPVVAIGGITLGSAPEIYRTGVAGIAVVSVLSRASDPAAVARALKEAAPSEREV